MDGVVERLDRLATGRRVLALFAGFAALEAVLIGWASKRIALGSGGSRPLDVTFTYTADGAYKFISACDNPTRRFYAITELSVDILFPIVTAMFLSTLILFLLRRGKPPQSRLKRLALVPFCTMTADFLENTGIVAMLLRYPQRMDALGTATGVVTSVKWAFAAFTLAAVLVCLARAARRRSAPG